MRHSGSGHRGGGCPHAANRHLSGLQQYTGILVGKHRYMLKEYVRAGDLKSIMASDLLSLILIRLARQPCVRLPLMEYHVVSLERHNWIRFRILCLSINIKRGYTKGKTITLANSVFLCVFHVSFDTAARPAL